MRILPHTQLFQGVKSFGIAEPLSGEGEKIPASDNGFADSLSGEGDRSPDEGSTLNWVRRSTRKTVRMLKEERRCYLEECVKDTKRESLLKIYEDPVKGRCVIAGRNFKRKEFVVEYKGDLISLKKAKIRESEYAKNPAIGSYMYFFRYYDKVYCVDATCETAYKGRLINHSRTRPNLVAEVINTDTLHLILTATCDIKQGEEILFDYGDRSCAAISSNKWLLK